MRRDEFTEFERFYIVMMIAQFSLALANYMIG